MANALCMIIPPLCVWKLQQERQLCGSFDVHYISADIAFYSIFSRDLINLIYKACVHSRQETWAINWSTVYNH